jgi:hypothetical protein
MRIVKLKVLTALVLVIFVITSTTGSALAEDFYIGGFWAPPAAYTNDTQYNYLRDANITHILNESGSTVNTVSENIALLDKCSTRGLKGIVSDDRTYWLDNLTEAEIDAIADDYINHSALGGYYVADEPKPPRWEGFAKAYNRFLYRKPGSIPYVNLQPYYADVFTNLEIAPTEAVSQIVTGGGHYVTYSTSLAQTFRTPSDCTFIYGIELNIDQSQWSTSEGLILRLWDSPSKTALIAERTLYGSNNTYYPRFELDTNVSSNTSYYFELLHAGGGDSSVGWVCNSITNSYSDGTAYEDGVAKTYDFYFKVYGGRTKAPVSSVVQLSDDSGHYVGSTNSLGQTFVTAADQSYIESIELKINYLTWDTSEGLTLTLWNSPSKTSQIAACTLYSTNNGYNPQFPLNVTVSPDTAYYFELTHNGGSDNSVGLVYSTNGTVDRYPDGTAYEQGAAGIYDLYFKVYKRSTTKKPLLTSQTLQGTGYYVTSANSVGQTFKTPENTSYIETIQLAVDSATWGTGESLTLKLWNSPSICCL